MLLHLRRRVERAMAQAQRVTLSTYGPAGIQSGDFECEARGMRLYLRIPLSSDHLFNLEHHNTVLLATPEWQVRGRARILAEDEAPAGLGPCANEHRPWTQLAEVSPMQFVIAPSAAGEGDTIDCQS